MSREDASASADTYTHTGYITEVCTHRTHPTGLHTLYRSSQITHLRKTKIIPVDSPDLMFHLLTCSFGRNYFVYICLFHAFVCLFVLKYLYCFCFSDLFLFLFWFDALLSDLASIFLSIPSSPSLLIDDVFVPEASGNV